MFIDNRMIRVHHYSLRSPPLSSIPSSRKRKPIVGCKVPPPLTLYHEPEHSSGSGPQPVKKSRPYSGTFTHIPHWTWALFGSRLLAICKHSSFSTGVPGVRRTLWEIAAFSLSMRIPSHLLGAELCCHRTWNTSALKQKWDGRELHFGTKGLRIMDLKNQWGMQTRFSASVLRVVWRMAFAQNRSKLSLPVLQLITENVYKIM